MYINPASKPRRVPTMPTDPHLDRATAFDLLANRHVRGVFDHLGDNPHLVTGQPTSTTRDALATHLERTTTLTPNQAAATLHHSVLPRLADAGLITYDAAGGAVHITAPERVSGLLALVEHADDVFDPEPWVVTSG